MTDTVSSTSQLFPSSTTQTEGNSSWNLYCNQASKSFELQRESQTKQMLLAVLSRDSAILCRQHDEGGDINETDEQGMTPLHLALANQLEIIVLVLLRMGADINSCSPGASPIHYAVATGNRPMVRTLLEKNPQVDLLTTDTGETPAHWAAKSGNVFCLGELAKLKPGLLRAQDGTAEGMAPMHVAAMCGHDNIVRWLLSKGIPPDLKTRTGNTALFYAVRHGFTNVARKLASKGADVNCVNASLNLSPLHIAAMLNNDEMVQVLMAKGAENGRFCVLDHKTALHHAAQTGNVRCLKALADHDTRLNVRTDDENGDCPIHLAAITGASISIEYLLNHGVDVNTRNKQGNTALHLATFHMHHRVVKLLVDKKADVNLHNNEEQGYTALHIAAGRDYKEGLETLLSAGARVDAVDAEKGYTPLHHAARYNRLRSFVRLYSETKQSSGEALLLTAAKYNSNWILTWLMDNVSDDELEAKDEKGMTALHYTVWHNNLSICRLLIRSGAHVNARSNELRTPLHYAARYGNSDVKNMLLDHGADITRRTQDGLLPLHLAIYRGDAGLSRLMVGMSVDNPTGDATRNSPLHIASRYGYASIVTYLLARNAAVNSRNGQGVTPLLLACRGGHHEVIRELLVNGADMSMTVGDNIAPIHAAVHSGKPEAVDILLQLDGGLVNLCSGGNSSPLHWAVAAGHAEVVTLLLKNEADPSITDFRGRTASQLAYEKGDLTVILQLL